MARIIGEVRPRYAFVENSPMLTVRGLGAVLGDLAEMGFDARWGVISAADVGAPHLRERIWIVGHAEISNGNSDSQSTGTIHAEQVCKSDISNTVSNRRNREIGGKGGNGWFGFHGENEQMANSSNEGLQRGELFRGNQQENRRRVQGAHGTTSKCSPTYGTEAYWWHIEPDVGRVAKGVAARVDRLKAIGNGQVPLCAATAWRILTKGIL
jgi:DNA (cytosine-5)-methyltransferase 1